MSPRAEGRLALELAGGDGPPVELPLTGVLVVGSSRDKAGLVVDGAGVADVHCAIGRTPRGGWALKDLGSEQGTMINGERVAQARLAAGDAIQIGSRRLRVVDPDAPRSVASPQAPSAARAASAGGEPAPPPAPAPEIQGYRIVRVLGRGAMGAVYLAVQQSLEREVALKVLPPRLARDADFVRRFQAEARAAAALNHPNVVTVHDVGQAGGQHYLTMEYMDRGSLEERVAKEGPLPWRAVLDVLHDAASGLVYAEARGIVHRDIKPANLMQNHTGATKIADLGLATKAEAESEEAEGGERKIFGTPHFISPEQVRGLKADARSDLYSLGATAYRLLSGHTPFEGQSSRDILRAKLREDPRPIRELAGGLPAEVEAIVTRLMQREPDARYPSATALLRDVDPLRTGSPAAEAPRKRSGLALAGFAVLGLAALGGALFFGGGNEGDRGEGTDVASHTDAVVGPAPSEEPDESERATPSGAEDDARERIVELEAENALLQLEQRDLFPADRLAALRALAEQYRGTTVATRALERAAQIEAEEREAALQVNERERALASLLEALRAAMGSADEPPSAAEGLRALAAVEGQEAWTDDPVFAARRSAFEEELLARALGALETDFAAATELEREGRFEDLRPALARVRARAELPEFPEGRTPASAARILEIGRAASAKLDGFDALVAQNALERRCEDARELARALGGERGLESELLRLDLDAAQARLAALEPSLSTEAARAWLAGLRGELGAAAASLRLLGESFGEWRRKSVADPRPRHSGIAEARGADAEGLVLDGDGGPEKVGWSAFGGQTAALHNLFHERLARSYTPEELAGVAALLRFSSVVEALRGTAEMLDPASGAVFTEREEREVEQHFDEALEWARKAGHPAALERERAAAGVLSAALRHASEGAWANAVADLERLLVEYGETLLVHLLSDGSGVGSVVARLPDSSPVPSEPARVDPPPGEPQDGGDGERSDGEHE